MLGHVIDRLKGQAQPLALNANGDPARFVGFGLHVLADPVGGFIGPLVGVLAGLRWARDNTDARWIVTAPVDTPFLPRNLVSRLLGSLGASAEIAVVRSRERVHPIVGLWPVTLADDLAHWLLEEERRAAHAWIETRTSTVVNFNDEGVFDPFFNVNTPGDVIVGARRAEEALALDQP